MNGLIKDDKYFINAVRLLENQIEINKKSSLYLINFDFFNKKYNRKLFKKNTDFQEVNIKNYFEKKIKNNYFYTLKDDFYIYHYQIPKGLFLTRNYVFFSYELLLVYYSLGIYLSVLDEKFVYPFKNNLQKILERNGARYETYSGTKISFNGKYINTSKDVYKYYKHYNSFYKKIKKSSYYDGNNKIIIKLDLQNFFDEIDIKVLLDFLSGCINNSNKYCFDENMKKEIIDFFYYMGYKKGIPQSDENIVSNYLSDLFLLKSDFSLIDFFRKEGIKFHYFRYVDDMFFVFDEEDLGFYKNQPFLLSQKISDLIYKEVGIRTNNEKNNIFKIDNIYKWENFIKEIKNISQISFSLEEDDEKGDDENVIEILNKVKEVRNLPINYEDKSKLNYLEEGLNRLNNVFNKSILEIILNRYPDKLVRSFSGFNFNYINLIYKPLIALIESSKNNKKTKKIYKKFIRFVFTKKLNSIFDIFLLSKYINKYYYLFKENESNILNSDYFFLKFFYEKEISICFKRSGVYKTISLEILTEGVIEQIKYRIIYEYLEDYSRAFSHLLNEFHNIIYNKDYATKKGIEEYNKEDVINFLLSNGKYSNKEILKIRNFFNRRHKNNISHSQGVFVNKDEYYNYRELIFKIYFNF